MSKHSVFFRSVFFRFCVFDCWLDSTDLKILTFYFNFLNILPADLLLGKIVSRLLNKETNSCRPKVHLKWSYVYSQHFSTTRSRFLCLPSLLGHDFTEFTALVLTVISIQFFKISVSVSPVWGPESCCRVPVLPAERRRHVRNLRSAEG